MMKPEIQERREYMLKKYLQTFSEQKAIDATAAKFHVNKPALYMDWSRRDIWQKTMVKITDNTYLNRQLVSEIRHNLEEVDELKKNTDNQNCRLGAHKLSINTRFRLIDFFQNNVVEELRKRIEKLEEKAKKGMFIP